MFIFALIMVYGVSVSTVDAKNVEEVKDKITIVADSDDSKTAKAEVSKEKAPKAAKAEGCSGGEAKVKAAGCGEVKSAVKAEGCASKTKKASAWGGK